MISLSKLLLLVVIAAAVWYGARWWRRLSVGRRAAEVRHARKGAPHGRAAADGPDLPTEDLVKCAVCGVYVPARGAPPCALPECPLRR